MNAHGQMATRDMVSRGQGSALAYAGDDRSHGGELQGPFRARLGARTARRAGVDLQGCKAKSWIAGAVRSWPGGSCSLSGGLAPPPDGKSVGTMDQQSRTLMLHTSVVSRLRSSSPGPVIVSALQAARSVATSVRARTNGFI